MTLPKLFPALAIVVFGSLSAGCRQSLERSERTADIEMKVDSYVQPYLEMKAFSGSILIARGGEILLAKGYGLANYELDVPNTPRTKFHLASISKTFTSAAMMIFWHCIPSAT